MSVPQYTVECVSENSALIYFGNTIENALPPIIANANKYIQKKLNAYITDVIPSYTTLLICVNTYSMSLFDFSRLLEQELQRWQHQYSTSNGVALTFESKVIEIPVFYSPKVAPDLARLAKNSGLTINEVIDYHSDSIYTVFTIGFLPGFVYMGCVNEKIAAPRLSSPRQSVAKGSVGIAESQTGIYPRESPGGWNIVGKTPTNMLNIDEDFNLHSPLSSGDCVKFTPINEKEFLMLGGEFLND